jgi:hypothetical protein
MDKIIKPTNTKKLKRGDARLQKKIRNLLKKSS